MNLEKIELNKPSSEASEPTPPEIVQAQPDIFQRLKNRGIEYENIHRIVLSETPHDTLFIAQWFKGRKISQILKQAEDWKAFLKKDFILSLDRDLKSRVERSILGTELLVWRAVLEANPVVGPWYLQLVLRFSDKPLNGSPARNHPPTEIRAFNPMTKETRRAVIPWGKPLDLAATAAAWRRAFEKLGLWHRLWKEDLSRLLVSRRAPQGWPVYSRFLIPRLYEFMNSHYNSPGHHWATRHGAGSKRRRAELPKELLEDMLEILKMTHPHVFGRTTLPQIKSAVQRHLKRKRQKKRQELSRPIRPKSRT
jgi:hypothetical protein